MVMLTVRGVSSLGPGRKKMCNFGPFLNCLILGYSKHTYLIVRGLKNAFFMSFTPLLYRYPYLIFVIFFTRAKFLENKIYTEKPQFFTLNL